MLSHHRALFNNCMKIKKTVTGKQLEANRKNGQRSRGPSTDAGKRRSSRNAIRHGLLSSQIVILEGDGKENQTEFASLLRGLQQDLSPEGTLENLLVERIASCYWRLRRAVRSVISPKDSKKSIQTLIRKSSLLL